MSRFEDRMLGNIMICMAVAIIAAAVLGIRWLMGYPLPKFPEPKPTPTRTAPKRAA